MNKILLFLFFFACTPCFAARLSGGAGGGGGGSGTPGGSTTQLQYNNGGSFGGIATATFTALSNVLTIGATIIFTSVSTTTWQNVSSMTFGNGSSLIMSTSTNLQIPSGQILTNSSSVTVQGVLTAGTNITLTPTAGILSISATPGTGASIYYATATAGFPFGIIGSTMNDNACVGCIGEYISTFTTGSVGASGANYFNMCSMVISSGDWDVSGKASVTSAGTVANFLVAISSFSANTTTDHVDGSNQFSGNWFVTPQSGNGMIANFRVSIATSKTYYFKESMVFPINTPTYSTTLSARRIR